MYYVFAIAKAARHRTTAAALPPTLLLGLPMHHSLAASLSSPFVRLSKFSMFIQFTLRAVVGEGETATE